MQGIICFDGKAHFQQGKCAFKNGNSWLALFTVGTVKAVRAFECVQSLFLSQNASVKLYI